MNLKFGTRDKELYVNPDEINVPPIFPDTAELKRFAVIIQIL